MAELVDTVEGETFLLTEGLKPLVGLLEADGGAVLLGEQTSTFVPLVSQGQPLQSLFRPELLHKVEDPCRQLQSAAALGGFGGGGDDPILGRIEGGAADRDSMLLKVEVLKFKAAQLLPTEPAEQDQGEKHLPADRGAGQGVKESLCLLQGIADLLLPRLQRWQRDRPAGVVLEHAHFDGVSEHGGDQGQVIFDALGGQGAVRVCLVRPRLTEAVDKLLYLPGRDLVHVQVAEILVHPGGQLLIVGLCALAQRLFHILFEPLPGEGLKLDVTIGEGGAPALFIKENHLPVQLLLDLLRRHAWGGRPGLGLHHLFSLRGVPAGGPEPVGIAALCVRRHSVNLPF